MTMPSLLFRLLLVLLFAAPLLALADELPLLPTPGETSADLPQYQRGLRQMQARDWEAAVASFAAAIDADPGRLESYHALAAAEAARGNILGARDALERGLALQPSDGQGWQYLGRVYLRLADLAMARASVRGAPEPVAEPAADPAEELRGALQGWLIAWQEKRVDDYLAAYDATFQPGDGRTLADWAAERRRRIARAAKIEIRAEALHVVRQGDRDADVGFIEDLRADDYRRRSRKRMSWHRGETGWRIVAEENVALDGDR